MFQTYLIIGSTRDKRLEKALMLRDTQDGAPVDTIVIPPEEDTSIKIEHVRQIQQSMSRSPMMGPTKTAIFLEMERASTETQHALLKLLEEPPSFALIILTADKKESLLPTILSRASVIKLKRSTEVFDLPTHYQELRTLLEGDASIKFTHGSHFETKEEGVAWLESVLTSFHQKLLENNSKSISTNQSHLQLIRKTNRALNTLKTTNTSPRLLMENLLLDLHSVPSLDPSHK